MIFFHHFHTVYPIAALLLGCLTSCIRTHGVLYEAPRSYEGLMIPNNSEAQNHNTADMKVTTKLYLYEAAGKWYLPVCRISYVQRPNVLGGWSSPPFERTIETERDQQTYYLPLPTETAKRLLTPRRSALSPRSLAQNSNTASLFTTLPPNARARLIRCPIRDFGNDDGGLISRTDTHVSPAAAIAYPAAALLAVGVDLPVSLLGSAILYTAGGVYTLLYPADIVPMLVKSSRCNS